MDVDDWPAGEEGRAWFAYLRAGELLEQALAQNLRATVGLSHPEFEILARLAAAPGTRLRMGQLAHLVTAPKTRLNHQIGHLEACGLVARKPDPLDKRGLHAVMTREGLRVFRTALPGHIDIIRNHLTAHLSPAQLTVFRDAMLSVIASLDGPATDPRNDDSP